MKTIWQDIRYGARMLTKRPGLTLTAMVVLALGIGANTALFSVVRSVLLSPLPFTDAEQLVLVQTSWSGGGTGSVSGPDYVDWAERNQVMEGLCAFDTCRLSLTGAGEPLALQGFRTSVNFFDVLGPNGMALGRSFRPDESQAGNHYVTVLSHNLWRDRFDSDPNIVGKTITLDGAPYTVIGVAVPMMGFIEEMVRIYIPLQREALIRGNRGNHYLNAIGRIKPGVSVAQAQAQMSQVASQLAREYPNTNTNKGVILEPLHEILIDSVRTAFLVLYGAVTVLLLVACVNVSNLLVAKASARSREIAIRQALGAGRARVIRQLLTESVLLGICGGILGLVLAFWSLDMLQWIAPKIQQTGGGGIPGFEEIRVNLPVLGFTIGLSLVAGLVFGMVPAWHGSRHGLSDTLKDTGQSVSRGRTRHRTLGTLVVAQIALAMILLTGAGLLVKSFIKLQQSHPGFNPDRLLALHVVRPNNTENRDWQNRVDYFNRVIEKLAALPGVETAGAIDMHPMAASNSNSTFRIVGKDVSPSAEQRRVSCNYFRCLGIPLVQGRTFTPQDNDQSQRVVVVSRELVRRYLPDREPIGQVISFWGTNRTIVGVVGDVKIRTLRTDDYPAVVYMPIAQECGYSMTFFTRTTGDPIQWAGAARKAIWEVDSTQPILYVETMDQLVLDSISVERFCAILLTVMACVALIMALVGLYGVMAFAVTERRNEIGIRMALGAEGKDILGLVIKRALVLTIIGIGTGLVFALALCRLMASLLYDLSVYDPATLALIPLALFGVAMLACYLPARKAAQLDPVETLRYE
ncbi:MAG: ABC transporter permease [Sedimentisphaerales bacterium]|jgi:putative ABC transport system permease protein